MIGFLIKKNFCDGWDNLLSLFITNIIIIFLAVAIAFLNIVASELGLIIQILTIILSTIIVSIFIFAYGETAAQIANFNGIRIFAFFKEIPKVLKDAFLFGLMLSLVVMISLYAIHYYFTQMGGYLGFFIGAAICWILIFFLLAMIWFIPIRSLMHNNFKKCLKKSFIILFDNTAFTLFVALYDLVLIAFTVLFVGLMPSISGILIANTNALRLRLYKYDYLEEHPELVGKKDRKKIPWEDLIYDDREALGPRKLKSFLFPWKE